MSNNLRQIAKDLRSFVKRCKDVHYSDSLLISFLITGLLTIAPKLHADVASEQQEITAQTYDAITDLRQSFMRARKENEKSLKGAQSELVQLLKQGDQVIKSPWASFQFGTGFTNNDWGTTYRGRGGKYLEYYRRDNDLTKYVFDKDKHLYGATNLNIPRNQEPNSLTINPANVHEPYKPYVPERLDNINMPNNPAFNPVIRVRENVSTYTPTQSYAMRTPTLTSINSEGAEKTGWGTDSTFIIGGHHRTYDGWTGTTANDTYPGTTTTTISGGWMRNGYTENNSTYYSGTHLTNTYSWWNPLSSWKSSVQYSLGSPVPNTGAGSTYYTPGGYAAGHNLTTGYDYISNRSYGDYTVYDASGNTRWTFTDSSDFKTNSYNYYTADTTGKGQDILGTGNTYNALVAGATPNTVGAPPVTVSYTVTAGGHTSTVSVADGGAAAAAKNVINAIINDQVNANYTTWFDHFKNSFDASHHGYPTTGHRSTLVYNGSGGTGNLTNLNVYIGQSSPGGSFAYLDGGSTYAVNNVNVELYNGNTTGNAGYVVNAGSATANMTFAGSNIVRGYGNSNSNNIAFNFQGNSGGTVSVTGPVDVVFSGSKNSVYKVNNGTLASLTITNGDGSSATAVGTDNLLEYNGAVSNKGRIYVTGDNNITFDNLAYVDDGKLTLGDVQMGGNNNIIVALQNPSQSSGATGVFGGEIRIQGAMSGGNSTGGSIVNNNIAVLASSGQGSGVRKSFFTGTATTVAPAVTIKDLNVGFGRFANNSTLIYANNGTRVNVTNTANGGVITDGYVSGASGLLRGYTNVKLGDVSNNTVMGYANGPFNPLLYGTQTTLDAKNTSTIVFDAPVDMVAKNGVAFWAANGGHILQGYDTTSTADPIAVGGTARDTRAGAYNSIIAFADGKVTDTLSPTYPSASTVKIQGNITAADNLVLNPSASGVSTADKKATYNNIGAAATNGGYVLIQKATAASSSKEDPATSAQSLIYGMGAYATGQGSLVEFADGTNPVADGTTPTNKGSIHVVSGENGALYATDHGQIKFNGKITHQNNVGEFITDGTDVRKGRGLGVDVGTANDHTNKAPFYVTRRPNGNSTGSVSNDTAAITFNEATTINMYDGILLTGNAYGNRYENNRGFANSDYHKEVLEPVAGVEGEKWNAAKYRGMSKVTAEIKSDNVVIGLINQAKDEIVWTAAKAGGTGVPATPTTNFLSGLGAYAGEMVLKNGTSAADAKRIDTTLINGSLRIQEDVNLEDIEVTEGQALGSNDTFNDIKMESERVTIDSGKNITGDIANRDLKGYDNKTNYQVNNAGLSMNNSLYRWDSTDLVNPVWRKTKNIESGFWNEGSVNVTGGRSTNSITALNVINGTVENAATGTIDVDHGNGMVGTNDSILTNLNGGTITVTGKYAAPANAKTAGTNLGRTAEVDPTGENYGIVGVSNTGLLDVQNNAYANKLAITNQGKITVDGDLAVGIYGQNNNNANQSDVTINYDNKALGTAGLILQSTPTSTPTNSRGVGIALVNNNPNYNGGEITLNSFGGTLGQFTTATNDIFTQENGIGIYGENVKVHLTSKDFTVVTKDNGVGLWVTDNSEVATGANHQKTFNYNYDGSSNKNGFAMAFGGKRTSLTTASNDLDIKFTNKADMNVSLQAEKAGTTTGTTKGIAGILVNTNDGADTVTNRGNIEEDKSKTNVRAYGAVVNKGTFVNYGNIKLKDSLDHQASQITSEDMKKVNVGIFANSTNKLDTTITNRGDITIGDSTNNKNIGSWAIYGYNVNTDSKEDGSKSKITINRNNYGIYSGDGNVNIKNTKLLVGNDTVLGHVQTTAGVSTAPGAYPIDRQNGQYSNANDLLSSLDKPRELDSAIGVYIDKGSIARDINVSADMDIDRFSFGIVMAEKNGGPTTNVTIGSPTDAPTIVLASNKNAGGQIKSTAPSNPKVPEETKEQGNSVYYYSADTESRGKSWANVSMNGDYNTAYYTKGSMDNYGTIDLRSKYDVDNNNVARGYGNVGIFSANTSAPSTNYGTITTGMSDTVNMEYSAAMAAGRNHYKTDGNFDKTTEEGYIVNKGNIIVKEKEGIGMFATGAGSRAINYGNIRLEGESAIGMYLDRGAIGENYGNIEGNAQSLKGVVAINGGYIKNYGHINVTGSGSYGIVTDGSRFIVDANGNPTEVLQSTDSRYTSTSAVTAGQTNGKGGTDLYGGTESSIEEGTSGNPKTTGVGTTITAPDIVPITKVSVDGIDTPIFNIETDAANPGDWAKTVTVSSSIQTGGTRIIDLSAKNEWGNPVWEHAYKDPLSEVTSIGMYVDTSGVRYTNPIDGIQNLPKLGKVDLYFGPEATMYTNSKAIRIGDKVDANGTVTKSNILKPFNDALSRLPGGAKVNVLSGSLTWQVLAKLDSNNQLSEIYMSKVPYHSFAYDNDKSLVNFTNNLDNIYEIAKQESAEKVIFNKLNSLGNGEGHILAQAFDQMRGHIYGGVQQRIKSTSDILTGEMNGLRSDRNVSKDSNKFKAFGQRNEFKTDTAGMPDWYSNAGGFAFVHEDETVRLGQSSGWSAGVVNNYFTFKDLSKSYENQAMAKVGVFKTIPLDANGTFVLSLGGDGFFGRNDMKRRFWVVDQEFRAKASYYSYGAGLNAGLEKAFVINDGFSIVPNVGIRAEYGRFSSIHENGDMALNVKSDDYVSVKPSVGIDFRYSQEVFKNSNLTASLGFAYENEIGKLYDVENEARIVGAWTDYFGIRGDKEDKRGNFKSDLKLGLDNGRFGFNVNTGYDSKGHNFRAGLGLKVLY
ncbi:autotransporter-associated N-terminal domain-containing protein [Leptotrichia sp. oral taxon 417]|uniref:autotransporter-associated N-terminal domain-containing protein n=1 Tax=Leptotrichia sp. oral taxon 417 TaxID=712365 RepID=UPI0015BF52A9|nr:autotransporter-associated N-terminal domain-containing protein [Leptotrichia sp. oral taxon 417]NWO26752.1 autotransporter-associated N-terminal domain-containing protein [Leptotrichia sp. oral taxon 417]